MKKHFEPLAWSLALLLLFLMDPSTEAPSLCVFTWLGVGPCPGCGLGHAVHHALRFEFSQSFHEHVLGLPATAVILCRIARAFLPPAKHTLPT